MSVSVRPSPRRGVYEQPFWEYVGQRQLHLQRCSKCGQFWYPPGPACPYCMSQKWTWQPVSGHGSLVSWVNFQRQYFPTIPPPYTIVAGELEEGPILITDVAGAVEGLRIGMPLGLTYIDARTAEDEPFTLYQWVLR